MVKPLRVWPVTRSRAGAEGSTVVYVAVRRAVTYSWFFLHGTQPGWCGTTELQARNVHIDQ